MTNTDIMNILDVKLGTLRAAHAAYNDVASISDGHANGCQYPKPGMPCTCGLLALEAAVTDLLDSPELSV